VAPPVTLAGLNASPKIRMSPPVPIPHHFTVDVEEHFQVAAFESHVSRSQWDNLPSRVGRGVHLLLELLAEHGAHGTFFILSWVAERQPGLVREIAEAGHEIASHGTDHRRVTTLTPDAFRQSLRDSKLILEDVSGHSVVGYRAPSFSITRDVDWALDVLVEAGYRYDSSLYPVRRNGYGYLGGQTRPVRPSSIRWHIGRISSGNRAVGEAPSSRRAAARTFDICRTRSFGLRCEMPNSAACPGPFTSIRGSWTRSSHACACRIARTSGITAD
jgi:Predicted xylanase/chitin deacetylase